MLYWLVYSKDIYLIFYTLILMKKEIVFVADITNDIDDVIAIEYLVSTNMLRCVVLDGKSRDAMREKALEAIGVVFEKEIPYDAKIIFCGGAFTKISDFVKTNMINLLVANGGFAGKNIVKEEHILSKFKNQEKVRTYNFNMDIDAVLQVISSKNIKEIILVSKNVCHSQLNCIDKLHSDTFLNKYSLDKEKCLHDLLMVKEGINYLLNREMNCIYAKITPICERKAPDKMSIWGSEYNENSTIRISVALNSKVDE